MNKRSKAITGILVATLMIVSGLALVTGSNVEETKEMELFSVGVEGIKPFGIENTDEGIVKFAIRNTANDTRSALVQVYHKGIVEAEFQAVVPRRSTAEFSVGVSDLIGRFAVGFEYPIGSEVEFVSFCPNCPKSKKP